jgi:A/G-specific adenine glycosylase
MGGAARPAGIESGRDTGDDPLQGAILDWYREHGRALAFRRTADAWAILVSEVIAQQTQASRAAERWQAFMDRFPTVESLAQAPTADVLRAWQGLGYDRRGLRLQRAAKAIVAEHRGRVPEALDDLEALPGIGRYTARAVAAIAFGRSVGAVDVNVRRVLGRIVAGRDAMGAAELQTLADAMVPPGEAAAWTHAVMDLGATICRPRRPRCEACPAARWCRYVAFRGEEAAPSTSSRGTRERFPDTNRWLRGRILDRLRAGSDADWVLIEPPVGNHDADRVRAAVRAMADDGLLEVDPGVDLATSEAIRARLPV